MPSLRSWLRSGAPLRRTLVRSLRASLLLGGLVVLILSAALRRESLGEAAWREAEDLARRLALLEPELSSPGSQPLLAWSSEVAGLRALAVHDELGRTVFAWAVPEAALPPVPGAFRQERRRPRALLRTVLPLGATDVEPDRWLTVDVDGTALARAEARVLRECALALAALLALTVLLPPWWARRLLRPLADLARRTRARAGEADAGAEAAAGAGDELEELDGAFSVLVEAIEERDQRLAEQSENLEQQVRMRTAELVGMNREIAHARSMAEEAVRTRSAFLAMMSHELRTPLNGVIGISGLLVERPLDEDSRELARRIQRSGQQLLTIVGDVLDFSKIDAGKLELEEVRFEPREPVEAACELLAHTAREKGLELVSYVEPDLPAVLGDPGRLQQIVLNYLGNAVKFTREGAIRVELTARSSSLDAVELTLSVVDTGIGIPEDRQGGLFESFRQAEASIARRYGGTGLGLAITRRLAELMNGKVGFESEVGVGSTFWCRVVLARAAVREARPVLPGELRGLRAVVCEPQQEVRETLARQLRAFGLVVNTCSDAGALRAELARPAALVLVDPGLLAPGDGPEAPQLDAGEALVVGLRRPVPGALRRPGLELPVREEGWRKLFERMASADAAPPVPAPVPERARPRSRPERILLAEDNETNQALTRYVLAQHGLELDVAENGEEALRRYAEGGYALVLMDCQMPVMDGFAATRALRAHEREHGLPRVPVLAMSANVVGEARARCLACGMDDFLSKPIDPDLVLATVERWLEQGAAAGEPPAPVLPRVQDGGQERDREGAAGDLRPGPSGVLDAGVLRDLLEADELGRELAVELMESYLATGPRLHELCRLVEEGDLARAAALAHKLVTTCGNVGALELARRLRALEGACEEAGAGAGPVGALDPLLDEDRRARAEVEALLAEARAA